MKRPYLPIPSDEPGVLLVPLTRGLFAKIDEADYDLIAPYRWQATNVTSRARPNRRPLVYAMRGRAGDNPRYLHRWIMGVSADVQVDHISGDTLDCRRANMREATESQNAKNGCSHLGATSPYVGVYWDNWSGRWAAAIKSDGHRKFLGRFTDEVEAAKAYDAAARILHGEFARLNFGGDE